MCLIYNLVKKGKNKFSLSLFFFLVHISLVTNGEENLLNKFYAQIIIFRNALV